jgi:hypothetical protein
LRNTKRKKDVRENKALNAAIPTCPDDINFSKKELYKAI